MNHQTTEKFSPTRRSVLGMLGALGAGAMAFRADFARAQVQDGVLRVVTYANPSTLDPSTGRSGADHTVLWSIFDTLIDFTPDLKPLPGLAESWEWEDDKTLVLTLRKGVNFHDGTDFDAEAVRANIDWAKTGPRSTIQADWNNVEEVEVRDPHTVVLHLNAPDAALLMVMSDRAGMMSSPKALEEMGEDYDRNPVGTGQMKFVKWDDNQQVVTEKNPDYWQEGLPKLDSIVFVVMTDNSTGVRSALSGQNNFIFRVPPKQAEQLKAEDGFELYVGPQLYFQNIYFNMSEGRGPMEDVRVRQAINFAINKEAYNQIVTSGLGEIAKTQFPESTDAFNPEAAAMYPYDPDRAKALLKEAGFGDGLTLKMNHYSDPQSVQRIEILQAMLGAVGITFESVTGSVPQSNKLWNDGVGDIKLSAWTGRPDPAMTFALLFHPTAYYNKGGAEPSKELTAAIEAMRSTTDPEARQTAIQHASLLERKWAMGVPLVFEPQIILHSDAVHGWQPNVLGKPRFGGVSVVS